MHTQTDRGDASSFRRLAWSNFAAQSAEQVAFAATPIVAVLVLGAGTGTTGLLQAAQTLPYLLFAIPAGMLADRASRSALMAGAEALRVAALLGVMLLAAAGLLNWPMLALLGFAAASGTVAYSVAAPSLVPALVAPQHLARANARVELARTAALAAGPAIGGALIGWLGASFAFGAAAAMSACAVLLLLGVREPARAPLPPRAALEDIREGARFVLHHALLRPVFTTQLVFNIAFFVLLAAFVPWAMGHLGLSAAGTGLVLSVLGAGMMVGALSAGRMLGRFPLGIVIGAGPVCGFAASLLMALTIRVPSPALAAAGFFLLGAGPVLWVIATMTLRQAVTPAALLGRVSAMFLLATGGRPLGAALGAAVGAVLGAEACLAVAALLFFAQSAVILASPAVRLARQPARGSLAAEWGADARQPAAGR